MWFQKHIQLQPKARGFHLIDDELSRQLGDLSFCRIGVLHLFIQHSSASLCINENADPTVRRDMERYFLKTVPDVGAGDMHYEHDYEGVDDMPAHIKSVVIGSNVTIPVSDGQLALGTWQGVYLGEHRIRGGARRLVATLQGEFE